MPTEGGEGRAPAHIVSPRAQLVSCVFGFSVVFLSVYMSVFLSELVLYTGTLI